MTKSLDVTAEYPDSGLSRHRVVMRYSFPPPKDDVDRALNPYDGSYHDYVRFYVPESATIAAVGYTIDGQPGSGTIAEITPGLGKLAVGVPFSLQRGHVAEISLDYQVGLRGGSGDQLMIQKQAGIPGLPVKVDMSYPGGRLRQSADLSRDLTFSIRW
jgi:hypothetical protein